MRFKTLTILVAGLILATACGLWGVKAAREEISAYAAEHALSGKQGLGVWVYDNPFQTGPARWSVHPAPNMIKPYKHDGHREHPFAWRWLALLDVPQDGRYVLGVYAPEAIRLRLDGESLVEHWVAWQPRERLVEVELSAGRHLLDLANVQRPMRLDLTLLWIPPGAPGRELIPTASLTPLDRCARPAHLEVLYQALTRWSILAWLLPLIWLLIWLAALRRPQRTRELIKRHAWFLGILALAALTRFLWAATVHGISGESAFFAFRAELILQGAWPFQGMATRTGPLWDYILTLPVALWGPTPWVLRGWCAVMQLISLFFAYRVLDRETGRPTALASCLALAVLPTVVMFGRTPIEAMALGPLLFFLGLYLFSLARRRPPLALVGGVLWGLGMYTHSVFIVFPFTLGLAALVVSRLKILKSPIPWGAGLGFILGMLPRFIDRVAHPGVQDPYSFFDITSLVDLPGFLTVFLRALDGEVVYRLYTGFHVWDTHWAIPVFTGVAALFLLVLIILRKPDWWVEAVLILALAVYLVMAPVGAPTANPRYFAFALILVAVLLGRALGRAWELWPGAGRWAAGACAGVFALFCLASLGANYFYPQLAHGGQPHQWKSELLDHTSDAWMDHGRLARELERRGYPVVATGDFWHHTLHLALNLYQGRPLRFQAIPYAARSGTERAAVFYNSPEGRKAMKRFLDGHSPYRSYKEVSLPPDLARQYILLEKTDPPVDYPADLEGF